MDQEWTVERVQPHDPNLYVNDSVCVGTMWAAKQAIYISNELSAERAWRTLMHELCHAYIAATQATVHESWTEEDVCELMSIYAYTLVEQATQLHNDLYGGVDRGQVDTSV